MSDTPLNVLQFLGDLEIGGAQEVVRTLSAKLAGPGRRIVVCAFRDGPMRQEIERLGIPVEILPRRRHAVIALPAFLAEMWRLRRRLLALIDEHDITVAQTHLLRSMDFLVLSLALQRPLQVYWTFHNAQFDLRADHLRRHGWLLRPKRWSHHLLYRLGARRVNGMIAVSEEVKKSMLETMRGLPAERITVIPNGVDVDRYRTAVDRSSVRRALGVADDDTVLAVVATFKRQKGHRFLLEAAAQVAPEYPGLHLLFIGDGELRPALEAQTAALGLVDSVHFLGTRHDVPELLAASDGFVLPSLWEGLPMALVEAMAAGLPVVATIVSGTKQVVIPGETGLLVPPGEPEPLAAALRQLLSDREAAAHMGARGRGRVETHFSAAKQAADHRALFERGWRINDRRFVARGEEVNDDPVFLAGPDRSGTTLIFALMASHPNISMVRRTNMWRYFHGRYGDLSQPENFERCLEHMVRYNRMRHLDPDPVRIREAFWQGEPTYGRLFALFHEHHARRVGKPRWGDKSLHTEHFADQVFAEFPRAKILHMSRDPRDRYASVRKRHGGDRRRVGAATARWLISMRAGARNERRYPHAYKIVRFEDLAAEPEATLRAICDFIGEPFFPEMLAMDGDAEHHRRGGKSSFEKLTPGVISTKPIGRFQSVLDTAEIAFIQTVARREMRALGYGPVSVAMSPSERLRFLAWDLPFNLARAVGWTALFEFQFRRGIRVPESRLRDISIPEAAYSGGA